MQETRKTERFVACSLLSFRFLSRVPFVWPMLASITVAGQNLASRLRTANIIISYNKNLN